MVPPAKISGPDLDSAVEFSHPDIWELEQYPDWSRIVIGARSSEIGLILDLCESLSKPFGVLWVLLGSRVGHAAGRYQSPYPVDHEQLSLFLYNFQDFFEQDGRHHLWITSTTGEGQFVFDNHNIMYAYGDLLLYEKKLIERGFVPGRIQIPAPHCHNYHAVFDGPEKEVMKYWDWVRFPLLEDDDP